jgi:hypothetical protein
MQEPHFPIVPLAKPNFNSASRGSFAKARPQGKAHSTRIKYISMGYFQAISLFGTTSHTHLSSEGSSNRVTPEDIYNKSATLVRKKHFPRAATAAVELLPCFSFLRDLNNKGIPDNLTLAGIFSWYCFKRRARRKNSRTNPKCIIS